MPINVATLQAVLGLDNSKFVSGMNNSVKQSASGMQNIARGAQIAGAALTALGAAGALALNKAANTALDFGKEVISLKRMTGLTSQEASLFTAVLGRFDVQGMAVGMTIKSITKDMRDEDGVLQKLGIAVKDSQGNYRSYTDIIADFSEQFKNNKNIVERNADAQALFGRQWIKLLPLLDQGKDGFKELIAKAKEYGLVLSDPNIKMLKEYIKVTKDSAMVTKGLAIQFGLLTIPLKTKVDKSMLRLLEIFSKLPKSMQETIKETTLVGTGFAMVSGPALTFVATLATVSDGLINVAGKAKALQMVMSVGIFGVYVAIAIGLYKANLKIGESFDTIAKKFPQMELIKKIFFPMVQGAQNIAKGFKWVGDQLGITSSQHKAAAKSIIDGEKQIQQAEAARVTAEQEAAIARSAVYTSEKSAIEQQVNWVKGLNSAMIAAFSESSDRFYNWVGLFDKVPKQVNVSGQQLLANLESQVKTFDHWREHMTEIGAKLPPELNAELMKMGPAAVGQIQGLSKLSEPELQRYVNLWKNKHQQAVEAARIELELRKPMLVAEGKAIGKGIVEALEEAGVIPAKKSGGKIVESLKSALVHGDTSKTAHKIGTDVGSDLGSKDAVDTAGRSGAKIGKEVVSGAWTGINKENWIFKKISEWAGSLIKWAKKALGIKSPSTEFAKIGREIVLGLAKGMDEESPKLFHVGSKWLKGIAAGMDITGPELVDKIKAIAQNMLSAFDSFKGKFSFSDIFTSPKEDKVVTADELMKNLLDQNAVLTALKDNLAGLKGKLPKGLFAELLNAGVGGASEIAALAGMSPEQIAAYVSTWKTNNQLTNQLGFAGAAAAGEFGKKFANHNFFANPPKKIMDFLDSLKAITKSKGERIGEALVSGMSKGMNNLSDWLQSEMKKFGKNTIKSLKDILGIHSPSAVFAGIGEMMTKGLAVGMTSMQPTLAAASNNMVSSAIPSTTYGGHTYNVTINANSGTDGRKVARDFISEIQTIGRSTNQRRGL